MFGFSCLLVLGFVCSWSGRKGREDVNGGYGNGDTEERGESKGGLCGWFDYGWILVAVVAIALWCSWVFWDGYLREFPKEWAYFFTFLLFLSLVSGSAGGGVWGLIECVANFGIDIVSPNLPYRLLFGFCLLLWVYLLVLDFEL